LPGAETADDGGQATCEIVAERLLLPAFHAEFGDVYAPLHRVPALTPDLGTGGGSHCCAPSLDPSTWEVHPRVVDWMTSLAAGLPPAETSRVHSWTLLVL
jgi:hypothetical protein